MDKISASGDMGESIRINYTMNNTLSNNINLASMVLSFLNDMKTFYVNDLEKKNIKKLNDYISKFDSSLNLMTNDELFNYDGEAIMMGNIREGKRKVGGSDLFYSNQLQKNLIAKVTG